MLRGILILLALAAAPGAIDRGLRAFQARDYAAAEQAFRQAIAEQPANSMAYKLLGMTFAAQEKYALAVEPFRKACTLSPREENACYYLGRSLYSISRFEQALEAYETALKSGGNRSRPLHGMALTLEALNRLPEAERYYKDAIAAGEERARIDYGLFLAKTGRGAEGLALLRGAGATAEADKIARELRSAPKPSVKTGPAPIRFEPSTLPMTVRNGATGKKYLPESVLGGVAVLDYDRDGWPDIFVANGAELPSLTKTDSSYLNRLFRNNHDGTFTDVTEKSGLAGEGYSMGVAAADYDNDGWPDLFVTGVRSNALYRNRGNGTFENVTDRAGVRGNGSWSVHAGWFDYDNDGLLDLFVVRYVVWAPEKEIFCGQPQPGYQTYCHPSHYQPLPNALYHNEGGGRFRDVSAESGIAAHKGKGMSVCFGDADGDGRLDVLVTNDTMPNFLFHNEGNGRFREIAMSAGVAYNDDGKAISAMGCDFRDYDNDGREDIFMTALSNETYPLFRNTGGRFTDVTNPSRIALATLAWTGWSTALVDLNNDGWKDIFAAGGHVMDNAELTSSRKSRQPNLVLTNHGDGTFAAKTLPGEAFHRAAAFADFDRDGRIDVAVTRMNDKPLLLRNASPALHWIAFDLTGARSNRDAVGARVHIVTAAGEQWNRLTPTMGYGSTSERVVHFGLGSIDLVKLVEIEWPSGARQRLENLPADRYVAVSEPKPGSP